MDKRWKIHWGSCTTQEAAVLLELPADQDRAEWRGFMRGPFCEYANTLTADFSLRPAKSPTLDAAGLTALVTEPCYWTAQMPFQYQVHLTADAEATAAESFLTGVKRFAARGEHLYWEQKRVVLRGLQTDAPTKAELLQAHKREVALLVADPGQEMCELASQWGVPLLVDLTSTQGSVAERLEDFAWHPAVMLVILSAEQLRATLPKHRWPFLLAAHCRERDAAIGNPAELCDLLFVESVGDSLPSWIEGVDLPVIAFAPQPAAEIAMARQACDKLQAALAPRYDLAGYFV